MATTKQDDSFAEAMSDHVSVAKSALDAAIDFIRDELDPEDIFSTKQLEQWAESNGYIKESKYFITIKQTTWNKMKRLH